MSAIPFFCPICKKSWQPRIPAGPDAGDRLMTMKRLISDFVSFHSVEYIRNGQRIPANCAECHAKKDPDEMWRLAS